jgi:hypothetical protein
MSALGPAISCHPARFAQRAIHALRLPIGVRDRDRALRFALSLAAYVVLALLVAIVLQSLATWLFGLSLPPEVLESVRP